MTKKEQSQYSFDLGIRTALILLERHLKDTKAAKKSFEELKRLSIDKLLLLKEER